MDTKNKSHWEQLGDDLLREAFSIDEQPIISIDPSNNRSDLVSDLVSPEGESHTKSPKKVGISKLSPEERKSRAKKAVEARWKKKREEQINPSKSGSDLVSFSIDSNKRGSDLVSDSRIEKLEEQEPKEWGGCEC